MPACSDASNRYLAALGFNIVTYPSDDIKPLEVLGRASGNHSDIATALGPLNRLLLNPRPMLPVSHLDQDAPDINGQKSSDLTIGIGFNLLATFVAALGGGNLGVSAKYTDAKSVSFSYSGVKIDSVTPLDVGSYMEGLSIDSANPVIAQYEIGNAELFVITKTAKSKKFAVQFKDKHGTDTSVNVPILQGAVGGSVQVTSHSENNSSIQFSGEKELTFAFQCIKVKMSNEIIITSPISPGDVFAIASPALPDNSPKIFAPDHLLILKKPS